MEKDTTAFLYELLGHTDTLEMIVNGLQEFAQSRRTILTPEAQQFIRSTIDKLRDMQRLEDVVNDCDFACVSREEI